jgi:hypothetical protein
MLGTVTIFELCPNSAAGIFAVPYRRRRPRSPERLPDGAIVEAPTRAHRRHAPREVIGYFGVAADGQPATIHDANLGLIKAFIALAGFYVLPSGDVAAVYGAQALPLG